MALLLTEPRTIHNFTTSGSDDPPIKVAEKMMKEFENQKIGDGINHSKCIELLYDENLTPQKSNLNKPSEVLKKFDRLNSDSKSLKFENSTYNQKNIFRKLDRNLDTETPIDFDIFEGEDSPNVFPVLQKLLSPCQ